MVNKYQSLNFNTSVYELCMLELEQIETGNDLTEKINETKKVLAMLDKPRNWDLTKQGNQEAEYEVNFTKFGLQLGKHYHKDFNSITVKEYYCFLELLENENKK